MHKLWVLGSLFILYALIVSGCATSAAQSSDTVPPAEGEICADRNTGVEMSYLEALEIAQNSACTQQGQFKETHFCNADTGTWWIDMDGNKPGCSTACVVNLNTKTAEINWRCTGAMPPHETIEVSKEVQAARDAALAFIAKGDPGLAVAPSLVWTAEDITPGWPDKPVPGSSEFQFTTGDWVVTVTYPIVAPEQTVYTVNVVKQDSGFQWKGVVDAAGQVTGHSVPAGPSETPVVAWYGHVVGLPAGAQYDDYLALWPEGSIEVGVSGINGEIETAIETLRDKVPPSANAHFWGTLYCDVPDYNGCQLVVERLRPDGPGAFFDPDPVEGWVGAIYSGPEGPRSGGDDYFVLAGDRAVEYGIWASDEAMQGQLESLRDSGTVVRVWGELVAGIPDWNGTQIQVSRIEVVADAAGAVPAAP